MRHSAALIFICLLGLTSPAAHGANDAGYESPFSIGVGARALGMGGGFTSLADDASAIYYNPAGLAGLENQEFSFMHMDLFEGTTYNFGGWVYPDLNLGGVGVGFMRIGTGDITRRSAFVEDGQFDFSQSQFIIGYGKRVFNGISFGANLKVVNQAIDNLSDNGIGLDLGAMAQLSRYVQLGLSFRDLIPPEFELETSVEQSPTTVAGGLALTNLPVGSTARLTATVELEKIEKREAIFHAGTELRFNGSYALRAGYDREDLALGAGLYLGRMKFDYSYKIMDYIDDSHRFSLTILVGPSISDQLRERELAEQQKGTVLLEDERRRQFEFYRDKAQEYYNLFRLDSALAYYHRALAFDDGNQQIVGTIAAIESAIRVELEQRERLRSTAQELEKSKDTYYSTATNFFDKKYYSAALDMLQLIFDIDPGHVEANRLKGDIEKAIRLDIAAELEVGRSAETQGDNLPALEAYNRVLELDPENQDAIAGRERVAANLDLAQQLNRGIEQFNAGSLRRARRTFNAVLFVDRDNPVALEYLTKIEASQTQETTLDELQRDRVIWQMYLDGLRFMRNKEYQKAIEAWNKVLDKYPNNVNTLNNIEQARLRLQSEESE